jgi:serine/threonine-protein kinase RsbW
MNRQTVLSRSFGRSVREVIAAERWLDAVAMEAGLPERIQFAMQVCLEELFSNIVRHSDSHGLGGREVDIAIDVGEDRIRMTVEDEGPAFDISRAKAHPLRQSLEQIEPGGLGILLVRAFSNDLTYNRIEGRNRVTLSFVR